MGPFPLSPSFAFEKPKEGGRRRGCAAYRGSARVKEITFAFAFVRGFLQGRKWWLALLCNEATAPVTGVLKV